MPKISKTLEEIRNPLIVKLFEDFIPADDIGEIFGLSGSAVYDIVKKEKEKQNA